MNPVAIGGGSVRLVVNGDELAGVKAGGWWVFTSRVGGVEENHSPVENPAEVIAGFTRAVLAADPGAVDGLRQLGVMLSALAEGGAS